MESKELREKIVVTIQKCNMGSPDELANQILALLPDRVDRDELIEARAKYINDVLTIGTSKVYSGNVYWYEMDGIDKEPYIKQATADVDWFLSHGLPQYAEAKIPENPFEGIHKISYQTEWESWEARGYNQALADIQSLNPSGLFTKEVAHE